MKMHLCLLLLLVLGLMLSNITETRNQAQETVDFVFLIDGSNNIGRANFPYIRDFMVNFIENLDVGPDTIRVGVAQYSDDPSAEFYLNTYSTKTEVLDAIKGLQLRGGEELKTGAALQFLVDSYFTESAGSRAGDGVPQVVFLLTSKKSSDSIRQGVLEIKRNGVFMFVIGLGQADRAEVKLIATDPIFTAEFPNFQVDATAQQRLQQIFSTVAKRAIVLEVVETIAEVPVNRRDIVFLIDGSASVSRVNFHRIRDFICSIVEKFEVGPDAVQFGLVQYSNNAKTEFYLNTFPTKAQVLGFIKQLRLKRGRPLNTGAALDYVFKTHFTSSAGSRKDKGIPQLLMLITVGKSKDDIKIPADTLKEASIMTLVIGGRSADPAELQKIVVDPSLVFNVKDFQSLPHVLESVMAPLSALAGITRVDKQLTPPLKTVQSPVKKGTTKADRRDIVFLVDGSFNIGHKNFIAIRDLVARIIGAQDIGSNKVRVGLVQYSDDAETGFYLNTYSTKAQLLSEIKQLRPKGGRTLKTGAALDYVSRHLFTKSAGSRREEGVPQFLIHIAGGNSVDDTKQSSQALLRAGVMILAVGAGNADQQKLSEFALDPSLVFYVREFRSLPDIDQQVLLPLSTLTGFQVVSELPTVPSIKGIVPTSPGTTKADRRDIVFLVDGSFNVGHKNFIAIRYLVARIIRAQDIGSNKVRVGLVQYSDDAETGFYLNTYSTKAQLLSKIKQLRPKGGKTLKTGAALDYVSQHLFTKSAGSRREEGVPQFLIHIAGGNSVDDTKQSSQALLKAGVMVLAVGAGNADQQKLSEFALDPSLVFYVKEFRSLPDVEQKVLLPLSTLTGFQVISELPTVPSIKGIVPTSPGELLTGTTKADRRDIVFLVDGSFNVGRKNFIAIRDLVARIIGAQEIGSNKVRVGLVQYSDDAETGFYLNTYSTKAQLLSKIKQLRPKGGKTLKTGAALDYVSQHLFTKSAGSRREEGVPQFLIHIAGGNSVDDTKQSSQALLKAGVMVLAVGAGNADQQKLSEFALDPSLVFYVREFRSLPDIDQQVLLPLSTLTGFQVVSELPTVPSIKRIVPTSPDLMKAQGRDIVFLIDGSTKVEASFPSVLKFLQSIIQELNIGRNADQIGVVQYSNDPKVEFFMNTYSNKEDILNAVQRMRLMGGRALNTGMALDYVIRQVFTKLAGSRLDAGVAQMLVLLTSGKSRDNVKQAGEALKQAAIVTFVIGGMEADGHELQEIAYSPNLMFAVEDFQSLPDIKNQLLAPLKGLTVEIVKLPTTITEGDKRDIVFLIDGTSKVGINFYRIRDFIYNLIQTFDVGEDKDRIAVVQYSDDARVEFPLNAYSNHVTLLDAVRMLRLKGGRTLKTGSALEFIMQNVLTKSAGSRRDLGISQILVLITSGKSQDAVRLPSEMLKRAGVVTSTIGINEADNSELHQIAYSPKLIFQVNDYLNLSDLHMQLLTVPNPQMIESVEIPFTTTATLHQKKADIVFALDGSMNIGRTNFPILIEFIMSIVDAIYTDDGSFRVGVVQYSSDVSHEFFLNSFTDREKVIQAIQNIQYKGGRILNTAEALRQIKTKQLIRPAGSRVDQCVPQIIILLTGGKSTDDALLAARELRDSQIKFFTVALPNADVDEMSQIASEQAAAFRVTSYNGLSGLTENILLTLVDNTSDEICIMSPVNVKEADKRDIVFLIDGSANIGKGFPIVREFLARMIGNFDVGEEKVQFGVTQFSENPKTEFHLNTYSTKNELLAAVKKLKLKRGKKLNIGAALDHVMKNAFVASAGSRLKSNIPQILLLLTSEKSRDGISQQAAKLQEMGIVTFTVGVKKANQAQLQQIAYAPKLAFLMSSIRGLFDIEHQLQTIMKSVVVELVETPLKDQPH